MNLSALLRPVFALLLCGTCASLWSAPKTDVIVLKNGDRVTGEIKSLAKAKLQLSTDHMGTIYIDWVEIVSISSQTGQAIELGNGTRFYGPLEKTDQSAMVKIGTPEGTVGVSSTDIVAMYPVEAGFWERLDLSVKLGFSWDKASDVGKYNFGLDGSWRDPRFITRGTLSTDITTQREQSDTTRTLATLQHMRFHGRKRFHAIFGSLENNDELAVDLRVLLGAGYGWIPVRDQTRLFGLMAGLAANREIPVGGDQETHLEAVGTLMYDYFLYDSPERRLLVDLSVFPSLTDAGRYRARLNTTLRWEIFSDFFWDLTAYGSYDNEPLTAEASTSDYGLTSSLGYKF